MYVSTGHFAITYYIVVINNFYYVNGSQQEIRGKSKLYPPDCNENNLNFILY